MAKFVPNYAYAPPGGAPPRPVITGSPPRFPTPANSSQDFLDTFLQANERSLQQFQTLLSQYASPLRNLVLQSSPELAQTQKYLMESYAKPFSDLETEEFRKNIRQAQIARGFEGGDSPAGAEAVQLTLAADQRRRELLPQLQQFGAGILGMTGLQPFQPDQGAYASLVASQAQAQLGFSELAQRQYQFQQEQGFRQMEFEEALRAAQEQSDFARRQFMQTQQQIEEMRAESKKKTYLDLVEEQRTRAYQNRLAGGPSGLTGYRGPGAYQGYNLTGSKQGLAF